MRQPSRLRISDLPKYYHYGFCLVKMECSLCTTFNHSVVISMTFCPECGKPVAASSKFCRNCGAYQLDDAQLPAVPAPVSAPAAAPISLPAPPAPAIPVQPPQAPPVLPQAAAQPDVQSPCSSCGSPLSPSEKFCGICGARAGQITPAVPAQSPATPVHEPAPAPAAVPVPSPAQSPVPVMGQIPGVRICNACGNVIRPGDIYCSKCLVIVRDKPLQAAPPAPSPVQSFPVAAFGTCICASCGSPFTGTEKFCGICGAPVASASYPVPAVAQSQPVRKTCSACGAPVSDSTKFCGGCGAPVGAIFAPSR